SELEALPAVAGAIRGRHGVMLTSQITVTPSELPRQAGYAILLEGADPSNVIQTHMLDGTLTLPGVTEPFATVTSVTPHTELGKPFARHWSRGEVRNIDTMPLAERRDRLGYNIVRLSII